ncbi:glutaminyl-peptide cyclotransferase [Flavobacterium rhizosphaerae]|uniref:Glutaminyl-peptide cyclotransferase n=1 Tax=Flavobacterium rhizosphaerae TaxID=3163298 RepID=A0ABW8YTG0_9FLAO
MKKLNLLAIIALAFSFKACHDGETNKKKLFSIDTSTLKQQYHPQESLTLGIKNPENKEIDSIVYYLNDTRIGGVKGNNTFDASLAKQKFGYQNIKALVFYNNESTEATGRIELVSNVTPKILTYEIVNTYPHSTDAYTQGLEFYRDTLIEGTGRYGHSVLHKLNYKTGEVYKQITMGPEFFGEGITVVNNKIYQLTWKEKKYYVYNADNLEKIKEGDYFKNVEGWGLTSDGTNLYMTDSTEKIWIVDPETFKEIDYINVYGTTGKIKAVNELEWVDGKIYGNVYQQDAIARINPENGAVEAVLNLADLKSKITVTPGVTDVLNGIAYNPKTKSFFITGKNWDKMFEIKIKE